MANCGRVRISGECLLRLLGFSSVNVLLRADQTLGSPLAWDLWIEGPEMPEIQELETPPFIELPAR